MPTLHLLGTGAAFSSPDRTTTMLALTDAGSTLVIDCGGDVVQRMLAAGIDLRTFTALLLTHEHIDHVGGFPLFMEKMWLAGRRQPLPVHGIARALDQARRCFATFDTSGWEGMPEVDWQPFPLEEDAAVLEDDSWRVTAAPARHAKPCAAFRIEHRPTGRVVVFSADTEPVPEVARLARGADVLVHEATGGVGGHSTAAEAGGIAADAGVGRLLLVHLPPDLPDADLTAARARFPQTAWGEELGTYPL